MRNRLLIAICLLSPSMLGCSDQPSVLVDTSGARFDWRCSKGVCELGLLPETPEPMPCPEDSSPGYSYAWGRFIEIVSVCGFPEGGGWSATPGDGRYLACEVDDDCPQLDFYESPDFYECSAGLCQNVDVDQFPRDAAIPQWAALPLCLADSARAEADWFGVSGLLTAHCGPDSADLCELPLPDPCWQPL
ncbi:MAG TPA: hypothetical protein VK034_20350 [Enhygromyxa sp.]|nr:hypothetical protein [Enhygromyxa sp.]